MSLSVAFLWHMHQPSYADPVDGTLALPWVRLHATRAYHDMAWLLERHPQIRATFNFVPVLVDQLQSYAAGGRDRYWTLAAKAPAELSADERAFVVQQFFSVDHERCVRTRPRYAELLDQRGRGAPFSDADLLDLQVLFNLAWAGFAMRADHPLVDRLDAQGAGFDAAQKQALLDLQIEIVNGVLPRYRALAQAGQIEITATPYYHPILPLLIDTEHAARCQPDRPRPRRFAWPDDAEAHVRRAIDKHTETFGVAPRGFWPAEGSVSPEAAALLGRCGVEWIASDEAQLWQSLGRERHPADLYQAWCLPNAAPVALFRDHGLSDLIGFTYARNEASVAVADLLGHLRTIDRDTPGHAVVLIALDGENPWEYYPDSGRPFLEALYAGLAGDPDLHTTTVAAHLDARRPTAQLPTLHSGSWIDGNFAIWIGGAMENAAWDLLGDARQAYEDQRASAPREAADRAYAHLLQAEGSDWFWWYGEPFQSDNDRQFDALFRGHLAQTYRALGQPVPPAVLRSLYPPETTQMGLQPRRLISPRLDRPATYFDWDGAGVIDLGAGTGSMHQVSGVFTRLRYGFDAEQAYLRLEADRPLDMGLTLRFEAGSVTRVRPLDGTNSADWRCEPRAVAAAFAFAEAGVEPGGTLLVTITVLRGGVVVDRYPTRGALAITAPTAEFEASHWSV